MGATDNRLEAFADPDSDPLCTVVLSIGIPVASCTALGSGDVVSACLLHAALPHCIGAQGDCANVLLTGMWLLSLMCTSDHLYSWAGMVWAFIPRWAGRVAPVPGWIWLIPQVFTL